MDADLGELGRRRRRANGEAFSPYTLFASGEQGVWYDPSDLTPEKVSWRRNLLTYSQDFENAAWTKSNASILSNLLTYSQEFDNAAWGGVFATITANTTTAPDGTTTADTVTFSAGNGRVQRNVNMASHCLSIYVKPIVGTRFALNTDGSVNADATIFDLSGSGSVVSTGANNNSSVITALSNGWYRLVTARGATAGTAIYLGALNAGGGSTDSFYIWGAQLVPGSTAQTYTRSLATAAPIQFADPLGGTLADKIVVAATTGQHWVGRNSATVSGTAGVTYTLSVYAKKDERSWFGVYFGGTGATGTATAYYNLDTGVVGTSSGGPLTASITDAGSGWYRCSVTAIASGGTLVPEFHPVAANGSLSNTGDGVSGIYVYGAQVEQASTASAYQRITDFSSDFLAAFPTHALYQESTGVTPVTALGQSVGLVLDKRLGALTNLGPELITNPGPNFTATTGWSAYDANATLSVSGGTLILTTTATSYGQQSFTTVVGQTYRVSGFIVFAASPGGGFWGIRKSDNAPVTTNVVNIYTSNTTSGGAVNFSGFFVATATTTFINMQVNGAGSMTLANISTKLVPGNHALQATSAARPTLQARSNLLTYSEQFDNVIWGFGAGTTVTSNAATAPDGTQTADRIVNLNVASGDRVSQSITIQNATLTGSIWLRGEGANIGKDVDVTVKRIGGTFVGTTITHTLTANWVRVPATFTQIAGNTGAALIIGSPANSAVDCLVWGAQLELASTASTYQRVVTATDYADVGLPRNLTFDGVDDSLATAGNVDFATWTVGTRRNLLTAPTMFDDAAWTKVGMLAFGSGSVANATTAPDGTTTADLLTPDTNLSSKAVRLIVTGGAGANTWSFYAKANGYNKVGIWDHATSGAYAAFLLSGAGSVLDSGTGASNATIISVGNGWYRCSFTATVAGSLGFSMQILSPAYTTGGVNSTWTANGTDGAYLWGAQLEVGSTATAFQDVGTDKVTLFSGVTKLSDAARAMLVEFGNAVTNSFRVEAPNAAAPNYRFASYGSLEALATASAASFAAPVTNVLVGIGDIGIDTAILRLNAVQAASSTSDQGTGNFGSYVLFVGRRNNATLPFNGRLFQLVIRGAATDSVTVGNAERWVGQLTGVAL